MNSDMHRELQESIDLLRGQFDELSSGIRLPHSLDADVLREQLNHVVPFPTSTPRKTPLAGGSEHCGLFRFDVGRGCDAVKTGRRRLVALGRTAKRRCGGSHGRGRHV